MVYKASDWNVYLYTTAAGSFVLDTSVLNGPDILGSSTGSNVKQTSIKVADIIINNGSEISQGVFLNATPSTMQLTVEKLNATANDLNTYYPGRAIYVTLNNNFTNTTGYPLTEAGVPNPVTETLMFTGYILDSSMNYDPNSDIATISIAATSHSTNLLNTVRSITKTIGGNKGLTIFGSTVGSYNWGVNATVSATNGELYTDFNLGDMYIPSFSCGDDVVVDTGLGTVIHTTTLEYYLTNWSNTVSTAAYSYTDADISNVQIGISGAEHPTNAKLTNTSIPAQVIEIGETDTSQTAKFIYQGSVDVQNTTELTAIANKMLSMTKKIAPISVTIPLAYTYQATPFKSGIDGHKFSKLAAIGETVSISSTKLDISNQLMLVTGRTIEVTPDLFSVTYNLWKGF